MRITDVLEWIKGTSLATSISESTWLFPTIETVHVLALALVVGSIALVDLRLLGISGRNRPVSRTLAEMLPWTWIGFAVAALSGSLMFASAATRYAGNVFFLTKLTALGLAGLNMVFFHLAIHRSVARWDHQARPPFAARMTGALSLALWTGIVTLGRWVGFV